MKSLPRALAALALVCACQQPDGSSVRPGAINVGSFRLSYDATTGNARYRAIPRALDARLGVTQSALTPQESAGLEPCAIIDTSKNPGEVDYCIGLIDPDSCAANWNPATRVLSFSSRLRNRSNELDDSAPYQFQDLARFPRNTSFFSPFQYIITALRPASGNPGLFTAVNTNIGGAACGGDGLSLSDPADDANGDGRFDCIGPEKTYDANFAGYPGFNFTPYVSGDRLDPGDDTGCVLFMQYHLAQQESFSLDFDLLAIQDDGSLPATPTVSTPTNNTYTNSASVTVSGGNCVAGSATVHIEGGVSAVTTPCTAGGTYSATVTLNQNTLNQLVVYQTDGGKQSGSANRAVTHDNIAPSILSSSPANGEVSVDRNTNCVLNFSEPMAAATATTTSVTLTEVSTSQDHSGSVSLSSDGLQAVLVPSSKPLPDTSDFDLDATTALTDLAGNALDAAFNATFTTAGSTSFFNDTAPPRIVALYPPDNTPDVPTNATYTIYFDEPVDPATIEGSVVDSNCNTSGGNIPNVFLFELNSCNASPQPIPGTVSLNAMGDIATFVPNDYGDIEAANCYGFVVTSCVTDLSGNSLSDRGTRYIAAYDGDGITYNSYNIFFTVGADTTPPSLVLFGPILNATDVHTRVWPFAVFDEALSAPTVNSSSLYITPQGSATQVSSMIRLDTTAQVAWYQPVSSLSPSTTYLSTATTFVEDIVGLSLSPPQTNSFTTASSADTTAPTIISVSPDANEDVDDKCPYIDIHFSEPMDPYSLNPSNIELIEVRTGETKPTVLDASDDGMHVRLVPESSLNTGGGTRNDWQILIRGTITDRAGNALGSDDSRVFETFTDSTAPTVVATVPPNGGSTSQNGSVLVKFSEPMDKSTLIADYFPITGCNPIVFVDPNGEWAVANCINQMTTGTKTLTVNRNVTDFYNRTTNAACEAGTSAGNRMSSNYSTSFTVTNGDDTTPPTVNGVSPSDGSSGVATSASVSVTFSEALDPRTALLPSAVFVMDARGGLVDVSRSISNDADTVTLTPISLLASNTVYYLVATTAVRGLGGGNAYDGLGGELVEMAGVLYTCFATGSASCP